MALPSRPWWRLPRRGMSLKVGAIVLRRCLINLFLEEKCSEIDSLIAIKQKKIEALKEYKKSVIYEYVTGKKQVN